MKYISILLSILLVFSFMSCKKADDTSTDLKDAGMEAVEEAADTVGEAAEDAVEAVEEAVEEAGH